MRQIILIILGFALLTMTGCVATIKSVTVAYNDVQVKTEFR